MSNQQQPLFPQPIPIIGCTGEYASGKTLFGLTIAPKETLVYDLEKSSESYLSLGFTRVDVPAELQKRYPGGYKPAQTFEWWRDHVRSLTPGRHRAIMLDPASEIESGITEWVRANPGYFGRTAGQYVKMSGLMWGDVKELWKGLLTDLASRCEVFVFAVHMADVWSGDRPMPGKRKPKGKSTLMELASLFLQMERKADAKGNVPPKPAAIVLKSRLAHTRLGEDGEVSIMPALPPRLPVATPAAIRQYLLHPPDYSHLRPEEQAPERGLSDDDRAAMRLATAEAERDTEQMRLDRLQRQQEASERQPKRPVPPQEPKRPAPTQERPSQPSANGKHAPADASAPKPPTPQTASFSSHAVRDEQLLELAKLRTQFFLKTMPQDSDEKKKEAWLQILTKRKVNTARALTQEQADELISRLRSQLDALAMQEAIDRPTEGTAAVAASGG